MMLRFYECSNEDPGPLPGTRAARTSYMGAWLAKQLLNTVQLAQHIINGYKVVFSASAV